MARVPIFLILLFFMNLSTIVMASENQQEKINGGCGSCRLDVDFAPDKKLTGPEARGRELGEDKRNSPITCVGCDQQVCNATLNTWVKLWGKWFGGDSPAKESLAREDLKQESEHE